jgi:hypothetical protein
MVWEGSPVTYREATPTKPCELQGFTGFARRPTKPCNLHGFVGFACR